MKRRRSRPPLTEVVQHIGQLALARVRRVCQTLEIERRGSCAATCPVDLASSY